MPLSREAEETLGMRPRPVLKDGPNTAARQRPLKRPQGAPGKYGYFPTTADPRPIRAGRNWQQPGAAVALAADALARST